ncbi:ABC transporter permease [Kineosporia sp. NBRC 101731]|uniref:ABC transporter permease n=1 Tax=Kineosporia sp. NBRC 101731 TaxID=3032199 RepID=UPI0024A1C716|nr:ABC transporter permease [Kineosporia sp. NBRC 101731]GLY30212.1 ABC transporter permease [Kineosporia sp. NBRC 101731]
MAAIASRPDTAEELPTATGRQLRTVLILLVPGLLWLGIFFVVPLFTLAGTSTQTPSGSGIPGEFVQTFHLSNYWDVISEYKGHFGRSFLYSILATVLCLAIGYPLAYLIAFRAGRARNLLLVLVVAPFFTSFVLRTLAWRQILSDDGWVVSSLKWVHVIPQDMAVTASPLAVVAGITYNFLPFMVLPLYSSLERIDPRLIEAGGDLYGNGFAVLRKVTFPLSMPGVVAGTLLTFIPASGDYVNAALLGNNRTTMVGNVVESRFFRVVDYPTAAALSFILMAIILVLVVLYVRRAGTEELV